MTPVDARKIWRSGAPVAAAASFAENLTACAPVLPVKALAFPELTSSARALPPFEPVAAPVHRRRGTFGFGEDAGDRRSRVEQRQHHIGASGIAHARGADAEAHALERRDFGRGFRRERGDSGVMSHSGALSMEWTCADVPGATAPRQGRRSGLAQFTLPLEGESRAVIRAGRPHPKMLRASTLPIKGEGEGLGAYFFLASAGFCVGAAGLAPGAPSAGASERSILAPSRNFMTSSLCAFCTT